MSANYLKPLSVRFLFRICSLPRVPHPALAMVFALPRVLAHAQLDLMGLPASRAPLDILVRHVKLVLQGAPPATMV